MIYQISGCSEALKKWLQHFLVENDFEYYLTQMPDGWYFDFDQTKKWMAKSTFFDELSRSGLADIDKQFVLQIL